MRVRDAADVSRTRGGVPRRAVGTCITPAEEAAAVRAGGGRAVRGAGPGARLGRAWRGRRVAAPPAPRPRPRGPAAPPGSAGLAPGGAGPRPRAGRDGSDRAKVFSLLRSQGVLSAGRRRPARCDTLGSVCMPGCMHPTRGGVGSRPPGPRTRPPRKVTGGGRRVLLLRAARRPARPGVGPRPARASSPLALPASAAGPRGVGPRRAPSRVRPRGPGLSVPGRSAAGARRARPPPGRPPALRRSCLAG